VAALEVISAEGAEAMTLRRLAQRLGVGTATLYWYIRDKEELIELVRDQLAAEILAICPREGDWRTRLVAFARAFRTVQARHPGPVLWAGGPVTGPNALAVIDGLLGAFVDSGLPDRDAAEACTAFLGLVTSANRWLTAAGVGDEAASQRARARTGAYLSQLSCDALPNVRRIGEFFLDVTPEARFGLLLSSFLEGIERRVQSA
jgi:TetR/AcrR family transcriptional regulator, tetracycline repressor protein